MKEDKVPKFTAHNNGDTTQTLKRQHIAVMDAARALKTALREASPNMRNYYVNETGEQDFQDDRDEFYEMVQRVQDVENWAESAALRAARQEGV